MSGKRMPQSYIFLWWVGDILTSLGLGCLASALGLGFGLYLGLGQAVAVSRGCRPRLNAIIFHPLLDRWPSG